MNKTDLTLENLQLLINISNEFNCLPPGYMPSYITEDIQKNSEKIFIEILLYSNFELYEVDEIRDFALDFIYNKKLNEMPLYLEQDHSNALNKTLTLSDFQWVPVVARWRLYISR